VGLAVVIGSAIGVPRPVAAQELPPLAMPVKETLAPMPSRPLGVVGAVLSIIDYTRWPGGRQPVELCIAGVAPLAQELSVGANQWAAPRRIVPRLLAPHDALPASCQVVFFDGWRDAEQRDAVTALAVRPVLTVGIGPSFCSIGGMFCLQPGPAGVRFAVNTDAVHRSGLTIHPNVLALGRPRPQEPR